MTRPKLAARGLGWVPTQNALTLAVLILPPFFRTRWQSIGMTLAGVSLIVVGGFVGIAAAYALGRNRTASPEPLENANLVEHGVYRFVRHPLYTSLSLVSVGWALAWGSGLGCVAAGALMLVLYAKTNLEERWLRERYPGYHDYERRVKRFLPGVW